MKNLFKLRKLVFALAAALLTFTFVACSSDNEDEQIPQSVYAEMIGTYKVKLSSNQPRETPGDIRMVVNPDRQIEISNFPLADLCKGLNIELEEDSPAPTENLILKIEDTVLAGKQIKFALDMDSKTVSINEQEIKIDAETPDRHLATYTDEGTGKINFKLEVEAKKAKSEGENTITYTIDAERISRDI